MHFFWFALKVLLLYLLWIFFFPLLLLLLLLSFFSSYLPYPHLSPLCYLLLLFLFSFSISPPTPSSLLFSSQPIIIFHNFRGMVGMSSKHLSRVSISDKEFFYTSRVNPRKREADSYNKFSLFTIKFIKSGVDSDDVLSLRNVQPSHCFEIITEDR